MSDREEMRAVSHTHPETGATFSEVYRRGPAVADGGEPDERPTRAADAEMRDVDHEAPDGDGAHPVWERGGEERAVDADAAESSEAAKRAPEGVADE